MCDECDSWISEAELMERLKEALDERDLWANRCIDIEERVAKAMKLIEGGHDQEAYAVLDA